MTASTAPRVCVRSVPTSLALKLAMHCSALALLDRLWLHGSMLCCPSVQMSHRLWLDGRRPRRRQTSRCRWACSPRRGCDDVNKVCSHRLTPKFTVSTTTSTSHARPISHESSTRGNPRVIGGEARAPQAVHGTRLVAKQQQAAHSASCAARQAEPRCAAFIAVRVCSS